MTYSNPDKAEEYANVGLVLADSLNSAQKEGVFLKELANISGLLGDFKTSYDYAEKAGKKYKDANDSKGALYFAFVFNNEGIS